MTRPQRKSAALAAVEPGFVVDVALSEILGVDARNERRGDVPADSVADLAADIAARGLINPLVLRPVAGGYRVLIGGRRWAALRTIRKGHETVRARVFSGEDEAAAALSRAENHERQDPHALEEADSVADSVARVGVDAVGRAQGKSGRWVEQRVALSRLPEVARRAWLAHEIGEPQARALAAFAPAEVEALFARPQARNILSDPRSIRLALSPRGVPDAAPAARFVGLTDYVEAGGRVQQDLFEDTALWLDAELLAKLVRQKLAVEADRLCDAEGWGHQIFEPVAATRQVEPDYLPEETEALAALDAGDPRAEEIERRAALRAVSQKDRSRYGVYLGLDHEGRLDVQRGVIVESGASLETARRLDANGAGGSGLPAGAAATASAISSRAEAVKPVAPARAPRAAAEPAPPVLHRDARRLLDTAASRACADAIAGLNAGDALRIALAAMVATGEAPVLMDAQKGAGGRTGELLRKLAKLGFARALGTLLDADDACVESAFAELVSISVDARGIDETATRALVGFLVRVDDADALRAGFAKHFDYAQYFACAGRAQSLAAIRACAGPAAESERTWMDDAKLAREAALLARAKAFTPEIPELAP